MTQPLLFGLDVGTSSVKAAAVDQDGLEVASARVPMAWTSAGGGTWIEASKIRDAAFSAIDRLDAATEGQEVAAIAVSSFAESGIRLDSHDEPIDVVLAWHDERPADVAIDLGNWLGGNRFSEMTGLILRARVSASQNRWLGSQSQTNPVESWLGVAEWLAFELGGEKVADISLASRTGYLNLSNRRWIPEIVEWSGLPTDALAPIVLPGTPIGEGTVGPTRGATISVAGHDHLAAAIGAGATRDGDVFDSCGTAEAFIRAIAPGQVKHPSQAVASSLAVSWHVLPDRQVILGGMQAGRALERILAVLGVDPTDWAACETLDAATTDFEEQVRVAIDDVLEPAASITGLHWSSSRPEVWLAALEAVAQQGRRLLHTVESFAGPTRRIVASGGWTKRHPYRTAKARHLGAYVIPQVTEPGARGAALIAGVAAGHFSFDTLPDPPYEEIQ